MQPDLDFVVRSDRQYTRENLIRLIAIVDRHLPDIRMIPRTSHPREASPPTVDIVIRFRKIKSSLQSRGLHLYSEIDVKP